MSSPSPIGDLPFGLARTAPSCLLTARGSATLGTRFRSLWWNHRVFVNLAFQPATLRQLEARSVRNGTVYSVQSEELGRFEGGLLTASEHYGSRSVLRTSRKRVLIPKSFLFRSGWGCSNGASLRVVSPRLQGERLPETQREASCRGSVLTPPPLQGSSPVFREVGNDSVQRQQGP